MIEITEMTLPHAYELARNLREGDRLECEALGYSPRGMMRRCYYESAIKKVTLLDGRVAGAWGVTGNLLGQTGNIWLMTSNEVEKAPLQLALAYRRVVQYMRDYYPNLENYCLYSYKKSLRMLKLTGFKVHAPEPYGPRGELFCRFSIGL